MLWSRSKSPTAAPAHLLGLELDATRARAAVCVNGRVQAVPLVGDGPELPLLVHLESGRVGPAAVRREPHLVCGNFLSQIGLPREWRGPRRRLTPDTALDAVLAALARPLAAWGGHCSIALPDYLTPIQVKAVLAAAERAGITAAASAGASLAIAAHRATQFLRPESARTESADDESPDWVVPLRPQKPGPGTVVILDVDDASLRAAAVSIADEELNLLAQFDNPRGAWRLWKDRVLDGVADRCVRLCRRDPRDSAIAEQGLWDQLEPALASARRGHAVVLSARADRWYQDISLTPAELESFAAGMLSQALEEFRQLQDSLPLPPKAVWLTARAALVPGLASALHEQSAEGAEVSVLPPEAGAEAAAALAVLKRGGLLADGHHAARLPRIMHNAAETARALSS